MLLMNFRRPPWSNSIVVWRVLISVIVPGP